MPDIRVTRTDNLLCEAMEKLLASKPYDAISVSELCKLSTVQRGTFYRHFEDKSDFFKYYLNTITERLLSEAAAEGEVLDDLERYAKTMHLRLIAFFEDHPRFVRNSLGGDVSLSIVDMAVTQIAKGITERAQRQAENGECRLCVPPDFLGRFYAGGMIQILRWWLLEDSPLSKDELERHSNSILLHCLEKPGDTA